MTGATRTKPARIMPAEIAKALREALQEDPQGMAAAIQAEVNASTSWATYDAMQRCSSAAHDLAEGEVIEGELEVRMLLRPERPGGRRRQVTIAAEAPRRVGEICISWLQDNLDRHDRRHGTSLGENSLYNMIAASAYQKDSEGQWRFLRNVMGELEGSAVW